jgi:uncharacterized membrane protein YfcA
MNTTSKIILIAFEIVNATWPFFAAWFVPGMIGSILGMFLFDFDGSEFVLGPLTLIAVIAFLLENPRKAKEK